ncbi:unnamed protein product, partial [Rotaria sp. Silwood2]
YSQVQSTVLEGISHLEMQQISIKRLDNCYALVITSDKHMIKIRDYFVNHKSDSEKHEER